MGERGFTLWIYGIALAFVAALMLGLYVQTTRLSKCQAQSREFAAQVEAAGKQAERQRRDKELQDKIFKEQSDAKHTAAIAGLNATVKRLRDERAAGGGLSGAAPGAGSSGLACYDRAEFAGALRQLDEGILGLVAEGAEAVAGLNTARQWASGPLRGR